MRSSACQPFEIVMEHFQRHLFHTSLSTSGPGQDQAASKIFVEIISLHSIESECLQWMFAIFLCKDCKYSDYNYICGNCLSYNVLSGRMPTRVQVNAWYREVHRCCRQCHRTLERTVAFCLQVVIACVVAHHPDSSACQHVQEDRLHPFKSNGCSGRFPVLVSTSPQCTGCAHSWREGNPPQFRW